MSRQHNMKTYKVHIGIAQIFRYCVLFVSILKNCKSVYHHTIQINHQLDATISPFYYLDVYLQLNMFRPSSRPSPGAQQLHQQPLVLLSERGDSSYNWPGHDQQHCYHHAPEVKPEAATAVVELLVMGVRTPETC